MICYTAIVNFETNEFDNHTNSHELVFSFGWHFVSNTLGSVNYNNDLFFKNSILKIICVL